MGEIVAPPSVMWRRPDLKSGAKIRWHGLLDLPLPYIYQPPLLSLKGIDVDHFPTLF